MSEFPFVPVHGQPADADGVIDEAEASGAARTLATAKQVASEAGRILEMRQQQEKATEEVVLDSGDQPTPAPAAEEEVVDKLVPEEPAAKRKTTKTRVTPAKARKASK